MCKRLPWMVMMLLAAMWFVGCAQPEGPGGDAPEETNDAQPSESEGDQASSPEKAVELFLTAVYDGDDEKTFSMVTPLAQKKAKEFGIPYSSQASDTASFEVTDVNKQGEDGAYVTVMMSDINPDTGKQETIEAVCVVSKSSVGWRVAGIATEPFPGEETLVFNFEDPVGTQKAIAEANARYMASMQKNRQADSEGNPAHGNDRQPKTPSSGYSLNGEQAPRGRNLPPSSNSGSPIGRNPQNSGSAVLR